MSRRASSRAATAPHGTPAHTGLLMPGHSQAPVEVRESAPITTPPSKLAAMMVVPIDTACSGGNRGGSDGGGGGVYTGRAGMGDRDRATGSGHEGVTPASSSCGPPSAPPTCCKSCRPPSIVPPLLLPPRDHWWIGWGCCPGPGSAAGRAKGSAS